MLKREQLRAVSLAVDLSTSCSSGARRSTPFSMRPGRRQSVMNWSGNAPACSSGSTTGPSNAETRLASLDQETASVVDDSPEGVSEMSVPVYTDVVYREYAVCRAEQLNREARRQIRLLKEARS